MTLSLLRCKHKKDWRGRLLIWSTSWNLKYPSKSSEYSSMYAFVSCCWFSIRRSSEGSHSDSALGIQTRTPVAWEMAIKSLTRQIMQQLYVVAVCLCLRLVLLWSLIILFIHQMIRLSTPQRVIIWSWWWWWFYIQNHSHDCNLLEILKICTRPRTL